MRIMIGSATKTTLDEIGFLMLRKCIHIGALFILNLSYSQMIHDLNGNSFLREIFISKVFKSQETKNIVQMIDYDYIKEEGLFVNNKNLHDGQVIQSVEKIFDLNLFLDDTAYALSLIHI